MNKETKRKNQFLDWAKGQLDIISELKLGSGDDDDCLRLIKKTNVLCLLDTLAIAFDVENVENSDSRTPFARLVEDRASWPDAKRISALHLFKAIELHLHLNTKDPGNWKQTLSYLQDKFPWILANADDACEMKVSDDPSMDEIPWPDGKNAKLDIGNKLSRWDFQHSYLLYKYRNCLVHESREQTFSNEQNNDKEPLYLTVGRSSKDCSGKQDHCEYNLVYPLCFLIKLAKTCIENLQKNEHPDPYPRFRLGPYIIPELNISSP